MKMLKARLGLERLDDEDMIRLIESIHGEDSAPS